MNRLDIAKLEPVAVVFMDKQDGVYFLETDTGAKGRGDTIRAAVEEMKKTTPAIVYLDTAQYLIVSPELLTDLDSARDVIKGTVRICCSQNPDMKVAADYLETHGQLPKLNDCKSGVEIPIWNS